MRAVPLGGPSTRPAAGRGQAETERAGPECLRSARDEEASQRAYPAGPAGRNDHSIRGNQSVLAVGEDEADGKEDNQERGDSDDDDIAEVDAVGACDGEHDRPDAQIEDANDGGDRDEGRCDQVDGAPEGEVQKPFHAVMCAVVRASLADDGAPPALRKMASP